MRNKTFKIVGRNPVTKRQSKKTVYTSIEDYIKYKDAIIKRWRGFLEVEAYELINGEWMLIFTASHLA